MNNFELFNMHGYGFYIFTAYFTVLIFLIFPMVNAWRKFRQYLNQHHQIKKVNKCHE